MKNKKFAILMGLCILTMGISGYKLINTQIEYVKGDELYKELIDKYYVLAPTQDSVFVQNLDWENINKDYPEIIAWLVQEDNNINLPIVQGNDNDYYLYKVVSGEYTDYGTPFVDYRIENPFKTNVTIVFGHHMENGKQFAPLANYVYDEDFYEKHKRMKLYTPKQVYDISIIGYGIVDGNDEFIYSPNINNSEHYTMYLTGKVKEYAKKDDNLVLLSTCVNHWSDNRIVVLGKLIPIS